MEITPLLKCQTLRIENHVNGSPLEWNKSIHLHKTFNSKCFRNASVRIHINKNDVCFVQENLPEEIKKKVISEVKKAFKKRKTRMTLIKDVMSVWAEIFNNQFPTEITDIDVFTDSMNTLANNFDLAPTLVETIFKESRLLYKYACQETDKSLYMVLRKDMTIVIGNNKKMVLRRMRSQM